MHPAVGTTLIALGAGACVTAASWWSAHATVAARLRANLGREAIAYAWELLTRVWHIPADRLVVSVFGGEEALGPDDEILDL